MVINSRHLRETRTQLLEESLNQDVDLNYLKNLCLRLSDNLDCFPIDEKIVGAFRISPRQDVYSLIQYICKIHNLDIQMNKKF